ncbi:MAG TPA: 50S ribosomal protein L31e [Nitrososphaeraceae archaeon]|jgi:large subunit ribosomal protein L31e|nr:50S ribosomal protein L31e [Nitrososphaeraceae archaeon]
MSEENATHVYTINLGKAWLTPQYRRTDRVINMIKEFAKRHMKNENIKIDQELNREIWKKGKTNPPRKVRVRMSLDDNVVLVSSYQEISKETDINTEESKDNSNKTQK